jgi:parallel beta-helix repeat protein
MKRLACIILIVALLISGLAFVKVNVKGTTVNGNITTNTEWTINDSPVLFNSSITVYPNATLTIDPGVIVNFGLYHSLTISGALNAIGTADNKITFTRPDNQTVYTTILFGLSGLTYNQTNTVSGGTIQYATFNRVALQLGSSSTTVDNCYFSFSSTQSAISVSGGSSLVSPIISNNKIMYNGQDPSHYAYGININSGATPIINNNEFDGNGQLTGINLQIYTPSGMSNPAFTISNNVFSNCWLGIKAETAATVTVQGNSFSGCRDGIDVNVVASLTIKNNLIDKCSRYGINGGGLIDSNTISNNQIGIHNPSAGSVITNNNIVGNTVNSITASNVSVNAQNNWWGIADEATIKSTLYDVTEDPGLGTITFVPFLNSPNLSAPTIPLSTPPITPAPAITASPTTQPTETATPTPTLPPTTASSTKKAETVLSDTSDLLNLNLITTLIIAALALVWVVVILGYVAKRSISRYKAKKTEK